MLCGFLCVVALGALFAPSPGGQDFSQRQIDAFMEMVDRRVPIALGHDEDRQALRAKLTALAAARAMPAKIHPLGVIPFFRPNERKLNARADLLAERAARALRARDFSRYLVTIGEFYAELGGYPGERAAQMIKANLAGIVYPLMPSVLTATGLVMVTQPELCGAEPGSFLGQALLGFGAPLVFSNLAVLGTKRGRDWLLSIGDPVIDQTRGAARVAARFWRAVSRDVGTEINPEWPFGRTMRVSDCDRLLSSCARHCDVSAGIASDALAR